MAIRKKTWQYRLLPHARGVAKFIKKTFADAARPRRGCRMKRRQVIGLTGGTAAAHMFWPLRLRGQEPASGGPEIPPTIRVRLDEVIE